MEAYEQLPRAAAEDVGMSAQRLDRIKPVARALVDDGSHVRPPPAPLRLCA